MSIIVRSQGIERVSVLIGPSLNKEISAKVPARILKELKERFSSIILGEKNIVTIEESSAGPGKKRFTISLKTGERFELVLERYIESVAGSAANITYVLFKEFLIKDIGIFGAIGPGREGEEFIRSTLERDNFKLFLFQRERTALSLSLQDIGEENEGEEARATLFCEKPPYLCSGEIIDQLKMFQPRIIVASSIRPDDFNLIEPLFIRSKDGLDRPKRIFTPHLELLRQTEFRKRILDIISASDYVQMNKIEAELLMGRKFEEDTFECLEILKKFSCPLVTITLGSKGSLSIVNQTYVIRQPGFKQEHPKDPTGAGDVHLAVMLYFYFLRPSRPPIDKCLEMASWVASCKVGAQGPYSGLPSKEARRRKLYEIWPEEKRE